MKLCTVCLIFLLFTICESSNILLVVPFDLRSHYSLFKTLGVELATRNHNVTIITAVKDENLTNYSIVSSDSEEFRSKVNGVIKLNTVIYRKLSPQGHHEEYRRRFVAYTEIALGTNLVQEFLKKDQHFDMVIADQFYNEAFYLLAYKYNCPLVLFASFGNCMKHNIANGNPLQLTSLYSEYLRIYDFGFWSKVQNLFITFYEYFVWKFWYLPKQEALAAKYMNLSGEVPRLFDVQKNAALLLMNRHYSVDPPAAYYPNLVEIGGFHIPFNATQNLPEDLQTILDNSPQGVILMSLGTRLLTSDLTIAERKFFIDAFKQLNQTVLWASDIDLDDLPSNVIVRRWFPQKEVLAHQNIHIFITHGGLLSVQEGLWHTVPMLVIPVHGDQPRNAVRVQYSGVGDFLLPTDLESLQEKLMDVLKNTSRYRSNAAKLGSRFQDRSTSALTTAMFWIEHVIEHGGVNIWTVGQHWSDYYNIDIIVIVVFVVIAIPFLFIKSVRVIKKLVMGS